MGCGRAVYIFVLIDTGAIQRLRRIQAHQMLAQFVSTSCENLEVSNDFAVLESILDSFSTWRTTFFL